MTEYLVDTHVLVWMMEGSSRLSLRAAETIRHAVQQDALLVSAITPWEIGMLTAKGRLKLSQEVRAWMESALGQPGVSVVPLLPEIAVNSSHLPWEMHPDPADRILVATARHLGATLVTADEQLLGYGALGYLRCQAAGQA